jgi:hypothetical protein
MARHYMAAAHAVDRDGDMARLPRSVQPDVRGSATKRCQTARRSELRGADGSVAYRSCSRPSFLVSSSPFPSFLFAIRFFCCHPEEGWRSADRCPGAAAPGRPTVTRQAGHPAGRPASLAIGTRASRRSTVAIFLAPDPRFRPRHFLRGSYSELLAARVIVPGGRFPCLPRLTVTSRSRETPRPAPPSGSPLESAPHEPG